MAQSQKKTSSSAGNGGVLNLIMFRYLPYWPLFIALIFGCLIMAWVYLRYYATPMYRASATILVKDEKKGVEDSKTIEALNSVSSKKIVENEMEVIGSRALMRRVVLNLALYAPISEEGRMKSTSAYTSSPIVIESGDVENLENQKKVYFSFDEKNNQVVIGKDKFPLDKVVQTPFGPLKFKRNEKRIVSATKPLYFSLVSPGGMANGILSDLKVGAPNKLSSVISLSLEDEVARRSKDILNELIKVYNQSAIDDKNALATSTLTFLDERIKYVETQLDSIEQRVQNFKSTKGIVDLSEQGKLFLQSVGVNDQKLTEINSKLVMLDEVEKYVISKDKASIAPATLGVDDPILSANLEKLNSAELQYEKLKRTTAENNPILSSVTNEIEKIRPTILETIRSQRKNLQASKGNLSTTNNNYASVLQTIPENERQLIEINRQKAIKNEVYSFLLNKREETQLTYASRVADSRLVDAADASPNPVSPKKPFIYLASIIFGLLAGIGYVSGREMLTNRITFRSEIENFTSVPVIAEITHISKRNLFSGKSKKQIKLAVAEQFRQLRMALRLYRKQSTKRKILVTSSIGGEGKSFVSSNVAKSLASSGKKVILVDFDMRRPKTSALFNLTEKAGLKEYLEGDKEVADIIQKTEFENLSIIPVGEVAINPTELLLDSRLGQLFTYLEDKYDYIIADSAPVQPVTDAYIISEFCDTTLFVVRHRYTPKIMIQLLDENNKIKALKNLSIVFNGVRSRGIFSKGIGYGYGYGYGYEYGYADRRYMGQTGKE